MAVDPSVAIDLIGSSSSGARSKEESLAFEALVNQHQTSIFRVAFRLTGDRDEAEDLVQESLLEAFEAFHRFRPGTHFDRWLFRIMRNSFLDGKKRRAR